MNSPLVIGAITIAVTMFWVIPTLTNENEATHEQYQTLSLIAANTQCQGTKDAVREALADDRLTISEFTRIAGHSKSVSCDRERIVADIIQSVQ